MVAQATADKLRELQLHGMLEALEQQGRQPELQQMAFDKRLGHLLDEELQAREQRRYRRLLGQAKLRQPSACVEEIDYSHPRGLDREQVQSLATCQWLQHRQNLCLTGPTGVGKTYLACALAHQACREGYSVRYYRMRDLFHELRQAHADGTYPKLARKLSRTSLLVLDDLGLEPVNLGQRYGLFEVIEDRYQHGSILVASQLPIEHWHEHLGGASIADATLDRLLHGSHLMRLQGESMRKTPLS